MGFWKQQWEQTVEAAKYSWKYEIGWGRLFVVVALILFAAFCLSGK